VGAALLVPGSLAIISASFPQALRGRAIGTWSGFTSITAALGPLMGGWLIDHASWRWAFLINVPVAIVVLAITRRHVAESRAPRAAGQDWAGAALAALALGGLVFGLIEASSRGWTDARVIGGLLLGAGALSVFVLWEARARSPMLPLGLFRSREFSGANLLTLLLYAALGGGLYFLPLNLIQVQGYSATAAGAALLPFILIMFGLSRWAGGLVDRRGAKLPLTVGPVIAAFGFLLLCLPGTSGSYWTTFFPAVLVLGVGMGISVAPLTTTVMGAVSDDLAGTASGVNNAASRVAAVLAIAVFGVVVAVVFNRTLDQRLAPLALAPEALRALDAERAKLAGAQLPRGLDPAQRAAARQAIKESYVAGFRRTMLACCGLALLGALTGWSMIGGKPRVTPASAPPP
jgi:EmrB/QacA subfamily drug resistance transporter